MQELSIALEGTYTNIFTVDANSVEIETVYL